MLCRKWSLTFKVVQSKKNIQKIAHTKKTNHATADTDKSAEALLKSVLCHCDEI